MGVYAVVGAAALIASVTHTLSVVVIVFELTGQINYMLPLLMAVIISFILSQGLSMSIYDVLLDMKGLPYLPALRSQELYSLNAIDLMQTDLQVLTYESNLRDIGKVIQLSPKSFSRVPIIDNERILCGTVSISDMKKVLTNRFSDQQHYMTEQSRIVLWSQLQKLCGITGTDARIEIDSNMLT
jgi:chloride channel 2